MIMLALLFATTLAPASGGHTFGQGVYLPQLIVKGPQIELGASCINDRRPLRPGGDLVVVEGESEVSGDDGDVIRYAVEVEEGLPVDPACFARVVELTLGDDRSWVGAGTFAVQRVDEAPDLRVTLASPSVVDDYCLPLRTGGIFSCWDGSRALLNFDRWQNGASDFGDRLAEYRTYMINHEVGHGLGHGHRDCTGAGDLAPLMMQQTKTTGACVPNGWPTPSELS